MGTVMSERPDGIDRRRFIRNAGIGTALVWSAPAVTTLGAVHANGSGQPGCRTLFSTNFDDAGPPRLGVSTPFSGFAVISGNIDIIGREGTTAPYDFYPGNGLYVDTDGTGSPGTPSIATQMSFGPASYQITFTLAGSTRGETNQVTVAFGTYSEMFIRGSSAPKETFTRDVVATASTNLSFTHVTPPDNLGLILFDASVSACT